MAATAQHAVVLGVEGVDMTGTAKGLRSRCGVSQSLYGGGSVMCRHACATALQLVYRYRKRRAKHRGIVRDLMGQVQFFTTADGDGGTEHAAGMLEHEVHLLGCYLFGGDNQVAFILAVFIVDHNHKFTFGKVLDGCLYIFYIEISHNLGSCLSDYTLLYIILSSLFSI